MISGLWHHWCKSQLHPDRTAFCRGVVPGTTAVAVVSGAITLCKLHPGALAAAYYMTYLQLFDGPFGGAGGAAVEELFAKFEPATGKHVVNTVFDECVTKF